MGIGHQVSLVLYIHTHTYIYMCIHMYIYIHIYIYIYACVCGCTYVVHKCMIHQDGNHNCVSWSSTHTKCMYLTRNSQRTAHVRLVIYHTVFLCISYVSVCVFHIFISTYVHVYMYIYTYIHIIYIYTYIYIHMHALASL